MFREDKRSVPISDVRHVSGENMGFALLLRKPTPTTLKSKNGQRDPDTDGDLSKQKPENAAARRLSAGNSDARPNCSTKRMSGDEFKVLKDNGCRNSLCRQNAQDMIAFAEERANMKLYISDLEFSVTEESATLNTLTQELDHFTTTQQALIRKLTKLDVDVDGLKQAMAKKKEEQKQLEEAIALANQTIRNLRHQKELAAINANKPQSSLQGDKKIRRKHNGDYSMVYSGKYQWSCCLAEDEGAMGCIDDYSVGLLSTMGRIKDPFRNYSKSQPFAPIHHNPNSLRSKQLEEMKASQKLVFGCSAKEDQHPIADFHHVGSHVPMESSLVSIARPRSAVTHGRTNLSSSTTLRPLNQRPQSAAPGLPRHNVGSSGDHRVLVESSSSLPLHMGRHCRAHSAHHNHHHHHIHHHHGHLNQSESMDLQASSILSSFHNTSIGKMRQVEGSVTFQPRNRPMSSPAGYTLYETRQLALQQQPVESSVTFADLKQ